MKSKKLEFRKNKRFFGIFSSIFTLIIIISSTLAWSSYSEWVDNHVQSNAETISVKVTEKFEQESVLSFEKPTEKSVKVKNISNRNAIIRVKFNESFLPFQVDLTDGEGKGNGNLKTVKRENKEKLVTISDTTTWKEGNLLKVDDEHYYVATGPIILNEPYTGESNRLNATKPQVLAYFNWYFNPALYDTPQSDKITPYWVFDGEYFYYSKILEGGETTLIDLLQSVQLAKNVNIPNKYKSALYDIQIEAEGIEASRNGLEKWTTDKAYLDMYQKDERFK